MTSELIYGFRDIRWPDALPAGGPAVLQAGGTALGRYDEATPAQMQVIRDGIPGSRWVVFENSAHLALIEETDRYLAVLGDFIDTVDTAHAADAPPSGHEPQPPWLCKLYHRYASSTSLGPCAVAE